MKANSKKKSPGKLRPFYILHLSPYIYRYLLHSFSLSLFLSPMNVSIFFAAVLLLEACARRASWRPNDATSPKAQSGTIARLCQCVETVERERERDRTAGNGGGRRKKERAWVLCLAISKLVRWIKCSVWAYIPYSLLREGRWFQSPSTQRDVSLFLSLSSFRIFLYSGFAACGCYKDRLDPLSGSRSLPYTHSKFIKQRLIFYIIIYIYI